ncbi:MAG: hypothetical protein U0822_11070 [Anaerolineae bacterium]
MLRTDPLRWLLLSQAVVIALGVGVLVFDAVGRGRTNAAPVGAPSAAGQYIILGWNDLGMHCYNQDFQDLAVLPPFNTLWAQVVRVGDPPQIVTTGITVSYSFPDNTDSVSKSNFWTYAPALFGTTLPPNIGLTGRGLAGTMDLRGDHFVADGIPLTEFSDSAPTAPDPYQLATIIVRDAASGQELARQTVVAPVSTEMHCDTCHHDDGVEGIRTGKVETNILTLHDREERTTLMSSRPVLCAKCHASNALGAPGVADVPSLSRAMHEQHAEVVPSTLAGCYNCHPGPQTQCLRDVMSSQHGITCINCHGTLAHVASNPTPWLNEPRCDNGQCHGTAYTQNAALYRQSSGHGGVYCEGCHDSTHAIAPSTQPKDGIKFINLQGHGGPIDMCAVCHATAPTGAGPHGLLALTPASTPTATPTATAMPAVTPTPTVHPGQTNKVYFPVLSR